MSVEQTSMNQLITDNIDIWTSTVKAKSSSGRGSSKKRELYGVKKLRELILELAVRGKLVPQDPNDEPASGLLLESLEEKEALLKQGLIKKSRSKKTIKEEHFYDYPASWGVSRLEDLIHVINGRAYKKTEMLSEGTPILRVGNLFTSNDWYYSDLQLEADKYIDNGDLIYAWSASFGPFIWDGGKVIYHYHIWKMDIFRETSLDKEFSKLFLQAISERIKASGNGIAMIHMTKERMEKVMHPLPPINEQHRIVAKVDELMTLCDQLEQQTEASIEAHQVLVITLLDTLTNSANADELMQNWARISEHFDTLFTTEASIDQLKQTILQLAVMGKLVPQDPNDEPAAKLLERIAEEKVQLIKDKKIKKQKALPPIADDKSLGLPSGWCSMKIDHMLDGTRNGMITGPFGSALKKSEHQECGFPVWGIESIKSGKFTHRNKIFVSDEKSKELESFSAVAGDIIISRSGTIDEVGVIPVGVVDGLISTNLIRVSLLDKLVEPEYFCFLFKGSLQVLDKIKEMCAGTTRLFLNQKILKALDFPIPPLQEQRRIILAVEQLFDICELLKKRLNASQQVQIKLTDAIVEQVI
ncbi:restriction endonuclease subunit S [Vibrio splendidus]|uniref:Restriction endonuclease subunit S n=1 Tax=Vibrio splendidus TaxID=29497 RepID=A0ABD5AG18_VIBSP|nr:restriction endonuclease subunit S [Vibrio splendidus]MDP2492182.1 restriction endonuclease subunit S [Vibrio splendidus]PMO53159.1 restriction endonuclease subunit S [Vibrio splendidus]